MISKMNRRSVLYAVTMPIVFLVGLAAGCPT